MDVLHKVQRREGQSDPDLIFFCPGCNYGHGVWITDKNPTTGAIWTWNGSMEKPTFSPSILHAPDFLPRCHLNVVDGQLCYCHDSTHSLSGKTVDMLSSCY